MASLWFIAILLLLNSSLFNLISCNKSLQTNQAALFVFGDSNFDAGNNNYIQTLRTAQGNYWPYGQTNFKNPTGRLSDGRLTPDFIAEYAWLPSIQPYLQPGNNQFTYGVNFASIGAGALVESFSGLVINLKTQLTYFKNVEKELSEKLGNAKTKVLFSKAVYLFSVGSNDYIYPLFANSTLYQSHSKNDYLNMVIGNITTVIKEIYNMGGRKFGFLGVGPLGCLPGMLVYDPTRIGFCVEQVTDRVKLHNQAFLLTLVDLQTKLEGFRYAYHDYYSSAIQRLENPSKYGFKKGKTACCGSGPYRGTNTCGGKLGVLAGNYELCENVSNYVFFDPFHPTENAHRQIADLFWNGSTKFTWPYNLKTLFEM